MNKNKKGFLSAAAILSIVASGFAILFSLLLFIGAANISESFIKDSYKDSGEYIYYEEPDGSYYFVEIDEDTTEQIRILESEIEKMAKFASAVLYVAGVLNLALPIAKLVLAIRILINNNREKYGSGSVISLLVLSILTMSIIESAFLIVTMCLKDENKNDIQPKENQKIEQITVE